MKNNDIKIPTHIIKNLSTIQDFFDQYIPSKKYQHLMIQNKWIKLNHQSVKRETLLNDTIMIASNPIIHQHHNTLHKTIQEIKRTYPILYEDDVLLAITKPPFLLIHSDGSKQITLCDVVESYYAITNQTCCVHPLHRLDYETSGIVLFCKNEIFQSLFDQMMSKKQINREYLAGVNGIWHCNQLIIEKPIGKDRHRNKQRISKTGQYAKTIFTTKWINHDKNYTIVHCRLKTGRTHQIRVHCAYCHHSLLNDSLYGTKSKLITRLALHAYKLSFYHPLLDKKIELYSQIPNDFQSLLPNKTII